MKKRIRITLTLDDTRKFKNGKNVLKLENMRCSCTFSYINNYQSPLNAIIYGMLPEDMEVLTTLKLNTVFKTYNHKIMIEVVDLDDGVYSIVYIGNIITSYAYYNQAPEVYLKISAVNSAYKLSEPNKTNINLTQDFDADDVLKLLATSNGYTYESEGTHVIVKKGFYRPPSTPAFQIIKDLCEQLNFQYSIELTNVVVLGSGKTRKQDKIFLISPETGMVSYPIFDETGFTLTCLYSPEFKILSKCKIKSTYPKLEDTFKIATVSAELDAMTPNGKWFSTLRFVNNSSVR